MKCLEDADFDELQIYMKVVQGVSNFTKSMKVVGKGEAVRKGQS